MPMGVFAVQTVNKIIPKNSKNARLEYKNVVQYIMQVLIEKATGLSVAF